MSLSTLIGSNVRALRARAGWRQDELGARVEWSRSKVAEVERGAKRITMDDAVRLCEAFDVKLNELLDGDEGRSARRVLGVEDSSELRSVLNFWQEERRELENEVEVMRDQRQALNEALLQVRARRGHDPVVDYFWKVLADSAAPVNVRSARPALRAGDQLDRSERVHGDPAIERRR